MVHFDTTHPSGSLPSISSAQVPVSVARRGYIPKAEGGSVTLDVEVLRTVAEGADYAVVFWAENKEYKHH